MLSRLAFSRSYSVAARSPSFIASTEEKVSRLSNGIRVATEASPAKYCTVGVAIKSGCRYEMNYPLGTTHMIEKLAFSSTQNYGREDLLKIMEDYGALIDCQSTRDTFLYAASCRTDGLDKIVSVIGDTVLRPGFYPEDIEITKEVIAHENGFYLTNPECEPLLLDWIHTAAYQGNTLGLSRYCRTQDVEQITRNHLFSYISQYHDPSRMVVAGVGVDHDELVTLVDKYFNPSNAAWKMDPSLVLSHLPPIDKSVAQYTGGEFRCVRDLSKMALGPREYPNLAHFVLGFESVGLNHPDFVAFCVLNTLLGGGGSFSAGGPGKGMFSRLYIDVLHEHHWMYNCTAYNHSYDDTGIFYIRASGPPENYLNMVQIILEQFFNLAVNNIPEEELKRAKTQLKSQIFMNLEMRPVMFEDLARQVLTHEKRIRPEEYGEKIDQITSADIKRCVEHLLSSKPSIVGYGDLKTMPSYEKIDSCCATRNTAPLSKKSMFTVLRGN
uniref:Mitochondrial-processing peptidase subunit alpha n=1 Tax=Panagrolaimus sp. ES5 TaxID=591445 RepID=A0AC34GVL3_9BILA